MEANVIGIIGGGVSGLAVAYELRRNAIKAGTSLEIHIFEQQPDLGGNADTVVVNLGNWKNPDTIHTPYQRWADLGVNDINFTAYRRIAKVMREIHYFDRKNPGPDPKMLPLENTETYFTWDSNVLLSDDDELEHGISNPAFEISQKDSGDFKFWINIVHKAADATVGELENPNIDITVGEFFDDVINKPKQTLKQYVDAKKVVDWNSPVLKRILTEIRDYIFYPRISAMYFANDYGPEHMLLATPMCYYRIQESKGGEKPDRRYFVGGSNRWLQALLENLKHPPPPLNDELVKIHFQPDFTARVTVTPENVAISRDDGSDKLTVDRCIITVHADDAANLLNFEYPANTTAGPGGPLRANETTIFKILQSISYTRSTAVCHTYSGLLPGNRNQWRSYNVLIRQGCSLKPYSMTYLCNRHQNDAGGSRSSEYNQVGLPQFFVTLNPQREIPDHDILRTVDPADIADELRAELPQLGPAGSNTLSYGRIQANQPAIAHFKHNLIDRKCFLAQRALVDFHETATNVFFGGGWSNGSGLHEECWQQAERIAEKILPVSS